MHTFQSQIDILRDNMIHF